MTKVFLVLTLILVTSATASATTWYVRTDGGTTTQCTGQTDAAYPGGSGQPCAYANPQDAINAAALGDTVNLRAGDTFSSTSGYSLPVKPSCTGASYVTIQSSNIGALASGRRVYPGDLSNMATLKTTDNSSGLPAITAVAGSGCYRMQGLEISNNTTIQINVMLDLREGSYFILDRNYIHPKESANITPPYNTTGRFAVVLTKSSHCQVTNNYIDEFFGLPPGGVAGNTATDTVGIAIEAGPADDILIENNFIEAWFNVLFLGGADADATSTATVSASPTPTLTTATLSNTTGLSVGQFIALKIAWSSGECKRPVEYPCWGVGRVTNINGNDVTFTSLVGTPAGGSPRINLTTPPSVPGQAVWNGYKITNVTANRNTLQHPGTFSDWQYANNGNHPKGYFEIKQVEGFTFTGNICQGFPSTLGIASQNQSGGQPWSQVKDVTIQNNWVKDFNIAVFLDLADGYYPNTAGTNISITNNLFTGPDADANTDGNGDRSGVSPLMITGKAGSNITVSHNTVLVGYNGPTDSYSPKIVAWGYDSIQTVPADPVVFKDNIVGAGNYVYTCDVDSSNNIPACWTVTEDQNLFPLNVNPPNVNPIASGRFPNSLSASNWAAIKFTNPATNDWSLQASSPGHNAGSDGKDIGVDFSALLTGLGTTWYVRNDGGTTTQCTGHTDAAYPGSGTGQPCAYANPQDAINAATWGDTIMVRGGDTFSTTASTPFYLTNKGTPPTGTDADYITLTTNPANIPAQLSQYPQTFTRITTAMAANMPKFRSVDAYPVFDFMNNAKYWKLEGFDISSTTPVGNNVRLIGQGTAVEPSGITDLPDRIIIQKCWLHPIEETGIPMNDSNFIRSSENGIYLMATNTLIQQNAIQGFAGIAPTGYQVARNGSLTQIESNANSGSVSVGPMPGEMWGTLVVGVVGRKSDTANYFSTGTVTFGGVSMLVGAAADSDPSKTQVCLFWSRVGLLGTQTLAWDWAGSGAPDDGVKIIYGFYGSTWAVRDAEASSQGTSPPFATGTLDVEPNDLVIAFAGASASADVATPTWSNVTEVQTYGTRFNNSVAAWAEGDQESDVAVSTGAWTNATSGAVVALVMRNGYRLDGKAVLITAFCDNYVIQNNLLEGWGNTVFTGGSNLYPISPTTIVTATLTSATLTDASSLNVGDIIAINISALGPGIWGNTIVATKNGNDITYEELVHSYNGNNHQQFTGHNVPAAGDVVQWRGYQPKNLTIRRNYFYKPPETAAYLNGYATGKGFMELKAVENGIVEGNLFFGTATGLVLTARNQNGSSPWGDLSGLIIRNNYWEFCGSNPVPLVMRDGAFLSKKSVNVTFTNNLIAGTTDQYWGPSGFSGSMSAMTGCTITHNTVLSRGIIFKSFNHTEPYVDDSYTYTVTGLVVKDNIFRLGAYVNQFWLDGAGSSPTVNWPSAVVNTNVLIDDGFTYDPSYIDTQWLNYFPSNTEVNSLASVGWTSYDAGLTAAGNYRLLPSSPYHNAASDGKDIGVDFDALITGLGFNPWAGGAPGSGVRGSVKLKGGTLIR